MRYQGTVKFYSELGEFGFIEPDGSAHSVYVEGPISNDEAARLVPGERVEFTVLNTPRGPRAGQVSRLAPVPHS